MQRNLKIKAAIIIAVILICIYGVVGIPKSKDELVANWNKNTATACSTAPAKTSR